MIDLLFALCLFNEAACRTQKIINYAYVSAVTHGVDPNKLLVLISCESRFVEDARGDWRSETQEYMANGLLQFWQSTFRSYQKKYGLKGKYLDPFSQIDLAVRIISDKEDKGSKHWYHCGKLAGFHE
jgi:hypothetical protein